MRELPAHHQHQHETEEKEDQAGETVLNADHLVVGGENVFPPRIQLVMVVVVCVIVRRVGVCGGGGIHTGIRVSAKSV